MKTALYDLFANATVIAVVIAAIAAIAGWMLNIIALVNNTQTIGLAIARAAGIFFPPLGAVLGYI